MKLLWRLTLLGVVGLNSIYFETIEKQYKYNTHLSCHRLCLLAVWPGKVDRGVEGGGVEYNILIWAQNVQREI